MPLRRSVVQCSHGSVWPADQEQVGPLEREIDDDMVSQMTGIIDCIATDLDSKVRKYPSWKALQRSRSPVRRLFTSIHDWLAELSDLA